jgi:hypothetical protein
VSVVCESLLKDLVEAVTSRDDTQVDRLLLLGVPPDVIEPGGTWSALHAAVLFNVQVLPKLLSYSRDPDAPQVLGGTPLSYVVHALGEKPDSERKAELFVAMQLLKDRGASALAGGADQRPIELARLYGMPDVEAGLRA